MNSALAAGGLEVGDVLAGKYRIDSVLGMGGIGIVYAAQHLQLGQRVAIKCLLPDTLTSAEAQARFVREAQAAARIRSEHVARVFDVGNSPEGWHYIVMEFLDGRDLAALLAAQGPLTVEVAVTLLLQAGEALAEAHAGGIVHRDIKPSNLFVTHRPDGSPWVKVLDFGVSKLIAAAGAPETLSLTKSGTIMGSPLYAAPEQMRSARDLDARADIWALGVVLFELVSGQTPFTGENLADLCVAVATHAPLSLTQLRPEIPVAFAAVVARCLEKEPARRFATLGELALALAPFAPARALESVERICGTLRAGAPLPLGAAPASSPSVVGAVGAATESGPVPARVTPPPAPSSDARRARGAWVGAAAVALAVAGGAWWFSRSAPTSRPAVPVVVSSATGPRASTSSSAVPASAPVVRALPVAPIVEAPRSAAAMPPARTSPQARPKRRETRGARPRTGAFDDRN